MKELEGMIKYKNKYRIRSARHPYWDYSRNGFYFVTICLFDRNRYHFGEIANSKMHLAKIGKFAESCWKEIPHHFPFVVLHNHIIMPNHMHGIIQIVKLDEQGSSDKSMTRSLNEFYRRSSQRETQNIASLRPRNTHAHHSCPNPIHTLALHNKNKFGPQSQNLGSIIRGYKIGVTKNAKLINPDFKWQAKFHDHIIRDENDYNRIQDYIKNNPQKWEQDKFNISL